MKAHFLLILLFLFSSCAPQYSYSKIVVVRIGTPVSRGALWKELTCAVMLRKADGSEFVTTMYGAQCNLLVAGDTLSLKRRDDGFESIVWP